MDTNKITSLSELWEHYQNIPISRVYTTTDKVHDKASLMMNDISDSNNDMYKSAIFKKLWNQSVIHLKGKETHLVDNNFYQADMFEHLDEYPDTEANEIVFSNGNLYNIKSSHSRGYALWKSETITNGYVDQAYNSLVGYTSSTMPGLLATRLTQASQVLNIDSHIDLRLTTDTRGNNEASLKEQEHWSIKDSDEPYFNHSSIESPLPLDLEIFSPLLSRKSSYEKPDGGIAPSTLKILLDNITLSDKSFPAIS